MTITSVQLWERIQAAGLASPEDCRKWAAQVASTGALDKLNDPNQLAAELIRLKKLTPFQANVLFANLPIPLAIRDFRITESLESKLGAHWFGAMQTTDSKNPQRFGFALTPQFLASPQLQSWPPSLALAESHRAITHPCLDHWFYAGIDQSAVVGFCKSHPGNSLADRLTKQPLTWQASISMIEQIASATKKLHDAGLVHGCICPEAIWCLDDNEFVLRRDPFFPPANPYSSASNSILVRPSLARWSTAAPELTLPASVPNVQTDLYALGCTWYHTLACAPIFEGDANWNAQDWANAHLQKTPHRFDFQQLPEPLQRCLNHLIAKNPKARFASAAALLNALEQAMKQVNGNAGKLDSSHPSAQQIDKLAKTGESKPQPVIVKETPASYVIDKPAIDKAPVNELPNEKQAIEKPANDTTKSDITDIAPAKKQDSKQPKTEELSLPVTRELPAIDLPKTVVKSVDPKPPASVVNTKTQLAQPSSPTSTIPKKKKKSKKKKKPVWLLPAMIVGACLVFGLVIAIFARDGGKSTPIAKNSNLATNPPQDLPSDKNKTSDPANSLPRVEAPPEKPTNALAEYFSVEKDDGQLLWAPPNAGSSFSLELFPAGVEAVLFLSGNTYHGRGVAGGLSQWWSQVHPDLVKHLASSPLLNDSRVASIAIALYPSKNPGLPQAVYRVSYAQPVTVVSIVQKASEYKLKLFDPKSSTKKGYWGNESSSSPTSIVVDDLQTDLAATVMRAVIGPSDLLASLPELNGSPAPLRRQLETLLKSSDSRSDVSLIAAPSFLFGDGRELLSATPKLQDALRDTIDESVQAISFSTTFEPRWYSELRMLSSETRDLGKLASGIKSRLSALPDSFEQALSSGMELHPYWRALGLRYPQMLRALTKFLRVGIEDGQVVANVYLPSDALNNVAISSWMALHPTTSSIRSSATTKPPTNTKPASKSIEEVLEAKISIAFDQESLEAALQLIAGEVADPFQMNVPISMSIDGASFQKEGITRNQSIRDFRQSGVPLRAVLTDLVRRANPVTTVQSPTEKNQKVVWLIVDDPDRPGAKKIELTTRTNAEAKKLVLPKEFVP